ncbi:hypothetical protein HBI56_142180 [Parastagonospora nodorum]|uniref:Uncharacterized protein n=1 Tax=Phaeosphaeria nodorum (strain SN15 / ATCC MYA-4574 / FGSC 10173) TaxID=321614 RepID=A0A7U2F7E5_PHANO|nr:hypothetical protein HBH56_034890 [Parastagonospora nodorum]QRD00135.1 hypothetical protein JI435_304980 [Parastagonospora nodorum SN15]KAH3933872.1 hypothetical protein HBH54_064560 [Parastagonospora nodorum]KAH3952495.1 hypothetical protein HBH53_045520 [Parastagonospora nodorum]KAH3979765.1 hypothetical protein HBH51_056530 [Parastagonospora nodorum]
MRLRLTWGRFQAAQQRSPGPFMSNMKFEMGAYSDSDPLRPRLCTGSEIHVLVFAHSRFV